MISSYHSYLDGKHLSNSKSGSQYIWFSASSCTQTALIELGYKYYTKTILSHWGRNMILKVINSYVVNGTLYCTCVNTIGFTFFLKASEVLLNID